MKQRFGVFNTSGCAAFVTFCRQDSIQPLANGLVIVYDEHFDWSIHTHPQANRLLTRDFLNLLHWIT
jgi:hypothetical protein